MTIILDVGFTDEQLCAIPFRDVVLDAVVVGPDEHRSGGTGER